MNPSTSIALAMIALAGCQQQRPDLTAMALELNVLKSELELVRHQTEDLDPRVRLSEQLALQAIGDREQPSRLDCDDRTPGFVVTRLAVLPTLCELADPLPGGGYRLQLQIGNPTAGRIDGLKMTLYAGAGAADGLSEARLFVDVPVSLAPGAWTAVVVDFNQLQRDQLGELAIRAQVGRIRLAHQ